MEGAGDLPAEEAEEDEPAHQLDPPAAEPALPPTNMRRTRMAWAGTTHCAKSTLAKPVPVRMEITWKKAWRRLARRS